MSQAEWQKGPFGAAARACPLRLFHIISDMFRPSPFVPHVMNSCCFRVVESAYCQQVEAQDVV